MTVTMVASKQHNNGVGLIETMCKTIGVLGGMGPYATLDFLRTLYDMTDAARDWEHFRVVMDSNPKIPSRTRAFLFGETDPVPMMVEAIRSLKAAGADFLVLPCNSAHHFISKALEQESIEFVDMVEATSKEIIALSYKTVGLLAGEATVGSKMYEHQLHPAGVRVLQVNGREQNLVRSIIEDVKTNRITHSTHEVFLTLLRGLQSKGAESIILGCTELQAVARKTVSPLPLVDSLEALAAAAIALARRKP